MAWLLFARPDTPVYLLDSYSGATVLLSLTKENSAYSGPCLTISRSNGSSPTDIGFSGTALDMVALNSYLAGGTAFVDVWYDESGNGNNATQTTLSKRFQIIVDTDGVPSLIGGGTRGMEIAD